MKSIYTKDQKKLLQLLKSIRKESGVTQLELAQKLNVPQSFVSKYESGERRLDLIELKQVCFKLKIDLQEFVRRFEG